MNDEEIIDRRFRPGPFINHQSSFIISFKLSGGTFGGAPSAARDQRAYGLAWQ
jgi:hypothetical protein